MSISNEFWFAQPEAGCDCTPAWVTGNRTSTITVTTNHTVTGGTTSNLVDGGFGYNTTDSMDFANNGTWNGGDYLRFQWADKQRCTAVRMKTFGNVANGAWIVQGSDDASSWTNLHSFTWTQPAYDAVTFSFTNETGFTYYQLYKNGTGGSLTYRWYQEVEFLICEC